MLRLVNLLFVTAVAFLALTGVALAAEAPPLQPGQALPSLQFWALVLGAASAAVSYVLNYIGPHTDEKFKAIVHVAVAAAVGAIYQLIAAGDIAWDTRTLEVVGTAVLGALSAHKLFFLPSGIAQALGGGRNRP